MKLNLSLKEPHIATIDYLKEKYSITSDEEVITRFIKLALELNKNDLIFATEREKCSGGCFASEPKFEIDIDEDDFEILKKIFKDYDFDEYETEEKQVSKVIRCIFNFIDDEPHLISV